MAVVGSEVTMKASDLFVVGAVGIGLYYVWKAVSGTSNLISCALNTAACAVNSASCAVSSGIANAIVGSTTCASITANGNVIFPSGAQVAVAALPVTATCAGATVQYQGHVYQLSQSDNQGNYRAAQIS
jgi:hypothetical protein